MLKDNMILLGKAEDKEIYILPSQMNRHGLIAGASGTGKTVTLKVIAESLSELGVPTFFADVKSDLTGMIVPGDASAIQERLDSMVADAKPFAQCIDEILNWIGEDTIVAHNATFDYHFLNEELKRIGREPMKNCVIDTLDLSRAILRDRRAYRLGNVARNYHGSAVADEERISVVKDI